MPGCSEGLVACLWCVCRFVYVFKVGRLCLTWTSVTEGFRCRQTAAPMSLHGQESVKAPNERLEEYE